MMEYQKLNGTLSEQKLRKVAIAQAHFTCERRVATFANWIAPESETEESIREQSNSIRERISEQARADDLTVKSTPNSGSYAKKTGLRRHLIGESEVEGQDVDLPFIVAPKTKEDEKVESLLDRFEKYAKASYPNTKRNPTKSSIQLSFTSTKLSYDLVPLLATSDPERQILLRNDGERRETSIQKHIKFVTVRTAASKLRGIPFNEGVRLMKWWREHQLANAQILTKVPSIVVDLLCAKAYDVRGVRSSYPETLSDWSGFLANLVKHRETIYFNDFVEGQPKKGVEPWLICDPVNFDNNVASDFDHFQIEELALWFARSRDLWAEAIALDLCGEDSASLEALVGLFGNPIRHHGGDEE